MTDTTTGATIDTAPHTETTDQATSAGVLLAQADPTAGTAIVLVPPTAGETSEVFVTPGQAFSVDAAPDRVSFSQDGGNLVLSFDGGGTVVLSDYLTFASPDSGALPPALTLADGTVITPDLLIADYGIELNDLAPAAGGGTPAAGAPAAQPGGGGEGGGGAGFGSYGIGGLGEGIDPLGLLGNLDLAFDVAAAPDEFVAPEPEPVATPAAAPVAAPEPVETPEEPDIGVVVDEDGLHGFNLVSLFWGHNGIPGGPGDVDARQPWVDLLGGLIQEHAEGFQQYLDDQYDGDLNAFIEDHPILNRLMDFTEVAALGDIPEVEPGDGLAFLPDETAQYTRADGAPLTWVSGASGAIHLVVAPKNGGEDENLDRALATQEQITPWDVALTVLPITGTPLAEITGNDYVVLLHQALYHDQAGTEDNIPISVPYQTEDGSGTVTFAVNDDTPEPKAVTVTYWGWEPQFGDDVTALDYSGDGDTIGWYVKAPWNMDDEGNPRVGHVIWSGTPDYGQSFTIEGYSEDEIGFFVIQNANIGSDQTSKTSALPPDWINLAGNKGVDFIPGNENDNIPGSDPGTRLSFLDGDVQLTVNDHTVGEEIVSEAGDRMATASGGIDKPFNTTGNEDALVADYGADGPELAPYAEIDGSALFTFTDDLNSTQTNLMGLDEATGTYKSITLWYYNEVDGTLSRTPVLDGDDGQQIWGWAGTPPAELSNADAPVFTMTLYLDGGYQFELLGAVEHEGAQHTGGGNQIYQQVPMAPDVAVLNIPGAIRTTDDDGDPVLLDFSIRIDDSVPVAEDKEELEHLSGDTYQFVITQEEVGADGLKNVTVDGATDVELTESANGWTVTFTGDGQADRHEYTITDNDGDTDTATVFVNDFGPVT